MDNQEDAQQQAPCFPGDGLLVYFMEHKDFVIIARLAEGEALASVWSWRVGDPAWVRNYVC